MASLSLKAGTWALNEIWVLIARHSFPAYLVIMKNNLFIIQFRAAERREVRYILHKAHNLVPSWSNSLNCNTLDFAEREKKNTFSASVHHLTKTALKSSSYNEHLFYNTLLSSPLYLGQKIWDNGITVRQKNNISPKQTDVDSASSYVSSSMAQCIHNPEETYSCKLINLSTYIHITILMTKYKKSNAVNNSIRILITFLCCQLTHHGKTTSSSSGLSNTYN